MSNPTIHCLRCDQDTTGFETAPYPGDLGKLIQKHTCLTCMELWKKSSVNIINEHKLRPFMPQDRSFLEQQMRQFLNLPFLS